jgi:hypothetical protein
MPIDLAHESERNAPLRKGSAARRSGESCQDRRAVREAELQDIGWWIPVLRKIALQLDEPAHDLFGEPAPLRRIRR